MPGPPLPVRLASVAALLVCVAACGSAPAQVPAGRSDIFLIPDTTLVQGLVPRNTTLDAMLRAHGMSAAAAGDVIAMARTVFDPRRLRSSQPFVLETTLAGALRQFEYEIDRDS